MFPETVTEFPEDTVIANPLVPPAPPLALSVFLPLAASVFVGNPPLPPAPASDPPAPPAPPVEKSPGCPLEPFVPKPFVELDAIPPAPGGHPAPPPPPPPVETE